MGVRASLRSIKPYKARGKWLGLSLVPRPLSGDAMLGEAATLSVVTRLGQMALMYEGFAKDLSHYCDGVKVRQRFRPKDLATQPRQSCPSLRYLIVRATLKKPCQQELVSIVHLE